jgi:hypothetical protein
MTGREKTDRSGEITIILFAIFLDFGDKIGV